MRRAGRIRQGPFLVFNQQFLTLIHAGLPILTALELLIKRQKDESLKAVLENVRDRVKGGELLSDAFAAQNMFPKMYTTTLMAGEKSGNMEEVLGRYIAFQRMVMTFRKKLLVSLVYPTLLISVVTHHADVPGHLRGSEVCRSCSRIWAHSCPRSRYSCCRSELDAQKYGVFVLLGLVATVSCCGGGSRPTRARNTSTGFCLRSRCLARSG